MFEAILPECSLVISHHLFFVYSHKNVLRILRINYAKTMHMRMQLVAGLLFSQGLWRRLEQHLLLWLTELHKINSQNVAYHCQLRGLFPGQSLVLSSAQVSSGSDHAQSSCPTDITFGNGWYLNGQTTS